MFAFTLTSTRITIVFAIATAYMLVRKPRRILNGLLTLLTLLWLWITSIAWLIWRNPDSDSASLVFDGPIIAGALAPIISALGFWALFSSADRGTNSWMDTVTMFLIIPLVLVPMGIIFVEFTAFAAYAVVYGKVTRPRFTDAIVVLCASLQGTEPTPLLRSRIDRGIKTYWDFREKGEELVIVMSGGQGADEVVSEAKAMAMYAKKQGVPSENIVLEDESTTTFENPRNTVAIIGENANYTVVTSDFHTLRAARLTDQLGMKATVLGSKTASYFIPSGFIREFVAVVVKLYRRPDIILLLFAWATWTALFIAVAIISSHETELVLAASAVPFLTAQRSATPIRADRT